MSAAWLWVVQLPLLALAVPAVAACSYLGVLTLLSAKLPVPRRSSRSLRFEVIVPAHNEAAVIARCLASLQWMDWPRGQLRLTVVADNCDDATADIARAAGAQVVERRDPLLRSKGYALSFGFAQAQHSAWADALVVIDADSEVSTQLLETFACRLEAGAAAIQARFGVLNSEESWRTGLIAIAHGAFHDLRSRARERLGLSCGLRGNGWCLSQRALREVPYQAFSLTEDIEYGIELGLAGHRVHYADEANVQAVMESREPVARIQRQRWEDGRFALIRSRSRPLIRAALSRPSSVCLDLVFDLWALLSLWQPTLLSWLWLALFCLLSLISYVLRGWQLSGRGAAGLIDLLRAPFFILWKIAARFRRGETAAVWIPTLRRRP